MCGYDKAKCIPEQAMKRLYKLILLQIKPCLIQFSLQLFCLDVHWSGC